MLKCGKKHFRIDEIYDTNTINVYYYRYLEIKVFICRPLYLISKLLLSKGITNFVDIKMSVHAPPFYMFNLYF